MRLSDFRGRSVPPSTFSHSDHLQLVDTFTHSQDSGRFHSMALRRTACTHLPWIILLLAWNIVSRRTFFILLCGFLLGLGSRYLSTIAAFVLSSEDDGALYNFEHGMLNLPIDCKSMWMNVGYWNVSRSMALFVPTASIGLT